VWPWTLLTQLIDQLTRVEQNQHTIAQALQIKLPPIVSGPPQSVTPIQNKGRRAPIRKLTERDVTFARGRSPIEAAAAALLKAHRNPATDDQKLPESLQPPMPLPETPLEMYDHAGSTNYPNPEQTSSTSSTTHQQTTSPTPPATPVDPWRPVMPQGQAPRWSR